MITSASFSRWTNFTWLHLLKQYLPKSLHHIETYCESFKFWSINFNEFDMLLGIRKNIFLQHTYIQYVHTFLFKFSPNNVIYLNQKLWLSLWGNNLFKTRINVDILSINMYRRINWKTLLKLNSQEKIRRNKNISNRLLLGLLWESISFVHFLYFVYPTFVTLFTCNPKVHSNKHFHFIVYVYKSLFFIESLPSIEEIFDKYYLTF